MQFQKVKKEIINSKKRDFVQNHTFYANKRFSAESKKWFGQCYHHDIMLKDGDLQNLSKEGLNVCFTADLYYWKSNFEHFPLKFTGLAKNAKREILRQK